MNEYEQLVQLDAIKKYISLAESELEAAEREIRRDGKLSESRYDFIQYYLNQADDELTPLFPVAHPDESEAST